MYNCKYLLHYDKWPINADNDSDKRRLVLSSEREPHKDKTVTVMGLDTKTEWLTDRQSLSHFWIDIYSYSCYWNQI
jgi:hypothetical protein